MSMSSMDPLMQAQSNGMSRLDAMASDGALKAKGDVDYRVAETPEQSCGVCVHFDGQQGCEVVAGTIDPRGVSDAFEPAEVPATETEAEAPLA